MAWVSVAVGGVAAAGKIFGAIKGGQANRASQALLNKQQEENKAAYNNNANKDFLQTNVAKDAVKEMNQANEDNTKAVAGRGAITGASDEALVAGNSANHQTFQNGLSKLAAQGTAYQNQQEAMFRGQKATLDNQQMDINNSKAQNAANLGDAAGQLAGTVAGVAGMKGGGLLKSSVSKYAGSHDSGVMDPYDPTI